MTNGYAITCPDGVVVIDAPEGMHQWLSENQLKPCALLLTHLHFDHIMDAAAISQGYDCPVIAHSELLPELHLGDLFAQFTGAAIEIENFKPRELLEGKTSTRAGGVNFQVLHVPGHSPDSVCFYLPDESIIFAGDTLFQSGVGRSDFPGGDETLLLHGIREKLLSLPDSTLVYPGHGGDTTIAMEKTGNPFLR